MRSRYSWTVSEESGSGEIVEQVLSTEAIAELTLSAGEHRSH